jgi:putative YhdH/YhfP family quinone oxidoreductase
VERFRAYRIYDDGRFGAGRADTMSRAELDRGDVVVRIAYAGVNYKDALTAQGSARMARKFPLVGGTDLSGRVESSVDARFKPGDEVFMHSFGLGSEHDGGFAELGRFPADWVFPLFPGLSLFDAAALGVAGHSVGVAIDLMQKNGLVPGKGRILVNGATGGVGSIAIDILSALGYSITALTAKTSQGAYLRALGASEVLDANTLDFGTKPLESEQWAGAVDSVGGRHLEWLVRTMGRDGVIASIGNASGNEFKGNVLPFILRGIRLIGINVNNPVATKLRIWRHLASDWKPRHLDRIGRRIAFEELPQAFDVLLAGKVCGRHVVDFSKGCSLSNKEVDV